MGRKCCRNSLNSAMTKAVPIANKSPRINTTTLVAIGVDFPLSLRGYTNNAVEILLVYSRNLWPLLVYANISLLLHSKFLSRIDYPAKARV